MRKKIEFKWETIDNETRRAKVIGGWVLHTIHASRDINGKIKNVSTSIVFIEDKDHDWFIVE